MVTAPASHCLEGAVECGSWKTSVITICAVRWVRVRFDRTPIDLVLEDLSHHYLRWVRVRFDRTPIDLIGHFVPAALCVLYILLNQIIAKYTWKSGYYCSDCNQKQANIIKFFTFNLLPYAHRPSPKSSITYSRLLHTMVIVNALTCPSTSRGDQVWHLDRVPCAGLEQRPTKLVLLKMIGEGLKLSCPHSHHCCHLHKATINFMLHTKSNSDSYISPRSLLLFK